MDARTVRGDLIADLLPFAVIVFADGKAHYVNRFARDCFGVSRKTALAFVRDHDLLAVAPAAGGRPPARRRVLVDGEPFYLDQSAVGESQCVLFLFPISYLTLQCAELDALSETAEDFLEIFQNSFDGIFVTDGQGKALWVNDGCERNYGINASELIGTSVADLERRGLIRPVIAPRVIAEKTRITAMQDTHTGKRILVTGIPLFDDQGNVRKVIINSRDATELMQLRDELAEARQRLKHFESEIHQLRSENLRIDGLVAKSPAMQAVVSLAVRVAPVDTTVLITGESGVGKEVIARLIHRESARAGGPFIKLNCGAIPKELLESELFGYDEGAFTGARRQGKVGILETAHRGTIFLDEIGELPLEMQAKLLQVLQDRVLTRVGSTTPVPVDFRIVAATNRHLGDMVQKNEFRKDLYFRLNVVPIVVPPLRERPEDLIPLIYQFLAEFNGQYRLAKQFSESTVAQLVGYRWPGNVRELRNVVERLIVTSSSDLIDKAVIRDPFEPVAAVTEADLGFRERVARFESKLLREALGRFGSTRAVAKELEISQSTVVRKLRSLGADVDEEDATGRGDASAHHHAQR